jgi:hypothetical protein
MYDPTKTVNEVAPLKSIAKTNEEWATFAEKLSSDPMRWPFHDSLHVKPEIAMLLRIAADAIRQVGPFAPVGFKGDAFSPWICPRCGTVHAGWVGQCHCPPPTMTAATTGEGPTKYYTTCEKCGVLYETGQYHKCDLTEMDK